MEKFSDAALQGLAALFVGKTVISDHQWKAAGQTARVYAAGVEVQGDKQNSLMP